MAVYELPDWIFQCIPGIDKGELIKDLKNNPKAKKFSVRDCLEASNTGLDLPEGARENIEKISQVINASKDPHFSPSSFKLSQKFMPKIDIISESASSEESSSSNESSLKVELDHNELYTEDVKAIADKEYHPMIDLLSKDNRIKYTELPVCVQEKLEKAGKVTLDRVKDVNANKDLFVQNSQIDSLSESMPADKIENIAKNSRRKSIAYKFDAHPSLIPSSISTIDKIVQKCEGKVDDGLLKSLRHIPNKSIKLDKLPPKVLECLEEQKLITYPQNFGDVILDYKRGIKAYKFNRSIRITNSDSKEEDSLKTDSVLKSESSVSGKNALGKEILGAKPVLKTKPSKSIPLGLHLNFAQLNESPSLKGDNLIVPKEESKHGRIGSQLGQISPALLPISEKPELHKRTSTAVKLEKRNMLEEKSEKGLKEPKAGKAVKEEKSFNPLSLRSKSKTHSRRFSRGDFAPGFSKILVDIAEENKAENKVENKKKSEDTKEETSSPSKTTRLKLQRKNTVAQTVSSSKVGTKTNTYKPRRPIKPKVYGERDDIHLIGGPPKKGGRRNTIAGNAFPRFGSAMFNSKPSNPFKK